MLDALKALFKLEDNEAVYWDDLNRAEEGVWVNLLTAEVVEKPVPGGVFYKRLPTSASHQMLFFTRIYKGSPGYHSHRHPDCNERCTSVLGEFIVNDNPSPKKTANFFRNTAHTVKCCDENELPYVDIMVEFTKLKLLK